MPCSPQALELPHEGADDWAEGSACDDLNPFYQHFDDDRQSLPTGGMCNLKHEDHGRRRLQEIEKIFDFLKVGLSKEAEEAITRDLAARGDYKVLNHYTSLAPVAEFRQRWKAYAKRFGYRGEQALRIKSTPDQGA